MEIKPIRMTINAGLGPPDDAFASSGEYFRGVADAVRSTFLDRYAGVTASADENDALTLLAVVGDFLALMSQLDHEYGANHDLPFEDAPEATDEALRALADLESWLIRFGLPNQLVQLQAVEIGVGYWAMRHRLQIFTLEPIIHALAARSNAATTKQETVAVYAMMQGFISHFLSGHGADLERSNPQRPWRLLNLNFAITAIRTGDAALIRYAFDTLNSHLPFDLTGFYGEAQALASQPGFPSATRALIEAESARWTRVHES